MDIYYIYIYMTIEYSLSIIYLLYIYIITYYNIYNIDRICIKV